MDITQCNPYIRFASTIQISGTYVPSISYDHRLFYFLEGTGAIHVNGRVYAISDNKAIIFPAGCTYLFVPDNKIATLSINFDYTQAHSRFTNPLPPVDAKKADPSNIFEQLVFTDYPALNQPLFLDNPTAILVDLYRIIEEMRFQKPLHAAYVSSLLKKVLCKAIRLSHLTVPQRESQLENILSYIHQHYSEPMDNNSLATRIGYHPYYVNRLMTNYIGTTLHQYLINYRLSMAADMLLETDVPIEQVAQAVGFQDAAYFSVCFKKKYTDTPFQYRKKHQRTP